jgi:hypothetical protein
VIVTRALANAGGASLVSHAPDRTHPNATAEGMVWWFHRRVPCDLQFDGVRGVDHKLDCVGYS